MIPSIAFPRGNFPAIFGPRLLLACALGLCAPWILRAAEPSAVSTIRPTRGDIIRYVTLPGTLRANQQVTVQARVPGFVKRIMVDRGDRVAAGQTLAEIEVPELLAERTKQQAEVRVAETEARRLEAGRARSPDLVTPQAVDAAAGRLDVARAELAKTETLLAYANLSAPFAGTVTARFVDAGAFVPAGAAGGASAVVTLAETRLLRAHVPVPESESVFVKVGQPVRLTVEGSTNVLTATVSRHAGAIDETTRSLLVEADLPNPEERLRPGMFATIRVGVEEHTGARLVPTESILVEKAGAFVFLVRDGFCRKTAVKPGFQDGARTEITSGIEDTSVIISPAKSAPADGAPVRTQEVP
ncbi:MAG: efflux RND transporter periplasmic adaptor subunit [Verrucomicrobiales bacterium]|nr:efflux RND transporter periplasmic adaptor subunit [Verrucomicrobiales bacterium]